MHEKYNTRTSNNNTYTSEDEIELIDLVRILWKWKYLIIGGTLVCSIAAIGISYFMPKIYLIDMVLQPGILNISNNGRTVYTDTPDNIKAVIEAGTYDNVILRELEEKNEDNIPNKLKIKVSLLQKSNTLSVQYETASVRQGILILESLAQHLNQEYSETVKYFKDEFDKEIRIKRANIQKLENDKVSLQTNIQNIEERIAELQSEVAVINENTEYLSKERNKFLSNVNHENSILSAILYSNTIQQNLQLTNTYKDKINSYKINKEKELQKISGLQKDIQSQLVEIENLVVKKNNIKNIQTIKPPSVSREPVKPKLILNVALAFVVGIFVMVFLSFVIETIQNNKQKREINQK